LQNFIQNTNMNLLKTIGFITLWTIFYLPETSAQVPQRESFSRNSFWTETVINGMIKNKWRYQLDYQYRRMSDASNITNASGNLFKNPFQHVYRPWLHYQMNDNVRLSISPLGFWETFTPAVEGGGQKKVQPEFRICPQLTLSNKIGRVSVDQRYRYEYRILGTKVNYTVNNEFAYSEGATFPLSARKNRVRYFVKATVPLGKHQKLEKNTFYLTGWNEVFLGFGDHTNNDKIWDQNRTFLLLGYKPDMKMPMRFEVGYGLQYANRFASSIQNGVLTESEAKLEKNNLLQFYIIVENLNEVFHLRKK
jgi:hypothetical protein